MDNQLYFYQVDEVNEDEIGVSIWINVDDIIFGDITLPEDDSDITISNGYVSFDIPVEQQALAAVEALRQARERAQTSQKRLVIIDRENLWQPEWGILKRLR